MDQDTCRLKINRHIPEPASRQKLVPDTRTEVIPWLITHFWAPLPLQSYLRQLLICLDLNNVKADKHLDRCAICVCSSADI